MSTPQRVKRNRQTQVPTTSARSLESQTLGIAVIGFILVAVVALPVFALSSAPTAGPGSVGQYAAIAAAVVATVAFLAGRAVIHQPQRATPLGVLDYLDIAALAFAHAIIALLSWTLVADIVSRAFIDAEVYPLAVLVLSGAVGALTSYVAFYSATHMDLSLLAVVLAVFLVEGVLASAMTANNPHWWEMNLSALGMTDDLSARAFNLTVIVAGFLVTTLARAGTKGIPTSHARGVLWVRLCLVLIGIFLAIIGIFHVDDHFLIHTGFASGMVVVYAVLVVMIRWWIPELPRAFFALGYLFAAVVVAFAILFAVGVYTLTAVELVGGILIFAWLILFIRNAAALVADANGSASATSPEVS